MAEEADQIHGLELGRKMGRFMLSHTSSYGHVISWASAMSASIYRYIKGDVWLSACCLYVCAICPN